QMDQPIRTTPTQAPTPQATPASAPRRRFVAVLPKRPPPMSNDEALRRLQQLEKNDHIRWTMLLVFGCIFALSAPAVIGTLLYWQQFVSNFVIEKRPWIFFFAGSATVLLPLLF